MTRPQIVTTGTSGTLLQQLLLQRPLQILDCYFHSQIRSQNQWSLGLRGAAAGSPQPPLPVDRPRARINPHNSPAGDGPPASHPSPRGAPLFAQL
jgi:hypothetical protein